MQTINQKTNIKWDSYNACGQVEGFDIQDDTPEAHMEAWGYLIATGQAWQLQGWYGRNARQIIDCGYIDTTGHINWDLVA